MANWYRIRWSLNTILGLNLFLDQVVLQDSHDSLLRIFFKAPPDTEGEKILIEILFLYMLDSRRNGITA